MSASASTPSTPLTPSNQGGGGGGGGGGGDHHHGRSVAKIPKACEPCRKRKIRCSGEQPCAHCKANPERCRYRLKVRTRPCTTQPSRVLAGPRGTDSSRDSQDIAMPDETTKPGTTDDDRSEKSPCPQTEVHHSVSAKHDSPKSTDSSQLFYGPSSNFAFLQQLHRGIILSGTSDRGRISRKLGGNDDGNGNVLEAGAGLDMFMQRPIFFGTPLLAEGCFTPQMLPRSLASEFLSSFKSSTMWALPFVAMSLDQYGDMLAMFEPSPSPSNATYQFHSQHNPQRVVVFLAVLAVGAQCSSHTKLAEELFVYARREAIPFEDTVTLPMVQFSLLLADYQINMARCNAAWLLIGNASRKAFALGLHSASAGALGKNQRLAGDDERETTVWSLYFIEVWLSIMTGRKLALREADISLPKPAGQPVLNMLCRLASVLVQASDSMYSRKSDSLRQLHATAKGLHEQLMQCAEEFGIGSTTHLRHNGHTATCPQAILMVHNVWYHAVMLTWRPFLVAEAVVALNRSSAGVEIWLVEACRRAIHAAQDAIRYIDSMFKHSPECRTKRFNAFFFEVSCAVLLHDSLRHPEEFANHMRFINISLGCFDQMADGNPVATASGSVRRMLHAVQKVTPKLSHPSSSHPGTVPPARAPPATPQTAVPLHPTAPMASMYPEAGSPAPTTITTPGTDQSSPWSAELNPNIRFPALENGAPGIATGNRGSIGSSSSQGPPATPNDLIFLGDWVVGPHGQEGEQATFVMPQATDPAQHHPQHQHQQGMGGAWSIDAGQWGVMTTDLYNWFPSDTNFMQ